MSTLKKIILFCTLSILFLSCKKNNPDKVIDNRNFSMGFTSWPYGPNQADVDDTYDFIMNEADIYTEHIDDKIPWSALINNTTLPAEFTNNKIGKASRKPAGKNMLLSVSFLNLDRSDIQTDYDGNIPTFTALNDLVIEDAYFKYLTYLIDLFDPNYAVLSIESNELKNNNETKWQEFKLLMANIRSRIKIAYPNLKISESITLHSWYEPDVANPDAYVSEIKTYVSQFDFTAISFYPYFKDLHKRKHFQKAFDFLHENTSKPIAFVETCHLANDLSITVLGLDIKSDEKEQNEYLETLLINADQNNYEFVIWWAHRDYYALWETFPDDIKDIGKIWRDTGLLEGDGSKRSSYDTWKKIFLK